MVRLTICHQGAQVLGESLARLAVERVWRASTPRGAAQRGAAEELGPLLVEHAKRLGIVER